MRVNREILLKIARETVKQVTRSERDVLSVYLAGSLLDDEFLLGGTTDIDLVFIWNDAPPLKREIRPLSEQIHLDIVHVSRADYRQTRWLRIHPWFGPEIARARVLFDPQHFMDFTQASVRGQFDHPEHVLARAGSQIEAARANWTRLYRREIEVALETLNSYLRAVRSAANAIASLSGPPLTERRFLLGYASRAEAARKPGLYAGTLGLLGWANVDAGTLARWLPAWRQSWEMAQAVSVEPLWSLARLGYYETAIRVLLDGDQPEAALWPLLFTWARSGGVVPDQQALPGFEAALAQLGLGEGDFSQRLQALDAYLDLVEETLEAWGQARGVG